MIINNVSLEWLGHASFKIKNNKVIYIDPFQISESAAKADIILITHSHYDHCSIADISKITKDGTIILCPPDCQSTVTKIKERIIMNVIEAGDKANLGDIEIHAVPAYNKTKKFHLKNEGWLGYVVKIGSVVVYHAGDTDKIKEMEKLTGFKKKGITFVALLPVGGNFTMNAEEAAEAASIIKPNIAIPIHYGSIVGKQEDAKRFLKLCQDRRINAEILEKGK